MSEIAVGQREQNFADRTKAGSSSVLFRLVQISWRNVWRNRRRSLLTAGGIIFAVWLLVFMRSFQGGVFAQMADICLLYTSDAADE